MFNVVYFAYGHGHLLDKEVESYKTRVTWTFGTTTDETEDI